MDLDHLFMLSPARRLQTFYGFPWYNSCAKPIQGRQMPIFEYESDAERFSNCGLGCVPRNNCGRNYYSPFS